MRTAAYARYSTSMQREASIDDQLRNILRRCEQEGWKYPQVYTDKAISGSRRDRPGFLALLSAATARKFDVILIDDLDRLGRDKDETSRALKRMAFAGARVIGVSDGTDTSRDGHELDTGIRAVIGEHYLRDLAKKTHRGLTGRALAGASAGGLPFGYRVIATGQRAIDEAQAAVVRRIYAEFVAGNSPRTIAMRLNAAGIKSSRSTWCMSAIYGDITRGIGILANPIYIGRQVWNRSRWVKHPETTLRIRKERPESEWIVAEHPELAIIDRETWDAAQARIRASRAKTQGTRTGGRTPYKHLLSGVLRCADCGGPYVVVSACMYGCGTARDRGPSACPSTVRVPRAKAEQALVAGIKRQLLTEKQMRLAERDVIAAAKALAPDISHLKSRLADAERVHANIVAALRAGIITPTTRAELVAAEAERHAAQTALSEANAWQPAMLVPRIRERWRAMVADLEAMRGDTVKLRTALASMLGENAVVRARDGGIYAEIPSGSLALVAGAGFGRQFSGTAVHILLAQPRSARK